VSSAKDYELTLLNYMIKKPEVLLGRNSGKLTSAYFEYPYAQSIFKIISSRIQQHKESPSLPECLKLVEEYADEKNYSSIQRNKLVDDTIYTYGLESTGYSGDRLTNFIFFKEAKDLANKLLASKPEEFSKNYSEIREKLDGMSIIGRETESLGLSLMKGEDINTCLTMMEKYNGLSCISTGWQHWDEELLGGFRSGEVAMFMSSTGMGKSMVLLNIGFNNAVCQNKRVVYITFDNQAEEMAERFYARWLEEPITGSFEMEKTRELLNSKVVPGQEHNFILQTWLPQRYNALDITSYLHRLKEHLAPYDAEHGVPEEECGHIDLVIIDYLEKMLPVKKQEFYRLELFQTADECVVIAKAFSIPVILASQSNKESMKAETAQIWMSGESYSKMHPCAHVMILSQSDEERLSNRFKIICGKNRRPTTNYVVFMLADKYLQKVEEDPNNPIMPLNSILKTDAGAAKDEYKRQTEALNDVLEAKGSMVSAPIPRPKARAETYDSDALASSIYNVNVPFDPVTGVVEQSG
jgi:hypothetical protein